MTVGLSHHRYPGTRHGLPVVVSGVLFGLVNAILGPILHILALPLTVITLGLFALVVNGVLLATTAGLSDDLDVGGFLGTILGALIISIVTAVLGVLVRPLRGQPA